MSGALDRAGTELTTSIVRALVVTVIFAGSLSDQPFIENHGAFPYILGLAALYAAVGLWLARARRPIPLAWTSILDLGFVVALMLASGGAFANVRLALFLFPVLAAVASGPRATARWAAVATALYVITAVIHDPGGVPGEAATTATFSFYLAGIGIISIGMAELLRRRNQRIEALAETSRTLAVKALEAEERSRRELAYSLHDEPIQQLLAAQLDLDRATRGDTAAAESARAEVKAAIAELREIIFDLHPSALEQLGLAAAFEQIARRASDRSGVEIELSIHPEADGSLDGPLFTIGRELLQNAVTHAGASRIELETAAEGDQVRLTVDDDGSGMDRDSALEALRAGHLGLAAVRERAEARGGRLELDSSAEAGTRASVVLPRPSCG